MCSPSMKWCGCVVLPGRYGPSRHPEAFLWLFTLLNTGVEWGADGRKLHPFSTCPVPDSLRARVTQPWPLQFAPGTLAKVAGDRPEARTSARLEVSWSSHLCNGLGSGGRGRAC